MNLSELLTGLVELDYQQGLQTVESIAVDTRFVDSKTTFLAAQGIEHHALDFFLNNMDYANIVYEPPYQGADDTWLACPNLHQYISTIGDRFYHHPSREMTVIGITGTDGKSSLVHLIAQALDAAMIGTIGIGKLNNLKTATHTTPDALTVQRQLAEFRDNDIDCVAMEISSHALDQYRVAAVDIDIALFSNLSREHLDYHQTMEAYFQAKASLFAKPAKHAIINIDDAYGRRLLDERRIHPNAIRWSVSSEGATHECATHSVMAQEIELSHNGLTFVLNIDGTRQKIHSKLLARFNVDNLLNVAASLAALDYSFARIVEIVENLHGVPGRVERITIDNGANAIVDYAHTPGALASALKGIRAHVEGKLWVVFGCGGDRDTGKRPLMAQAAEKYADRVVITDDNPRTEDPKAIVADILTGIDDKARVDVIQPREQAIEFVLQQLNSQDAVLIAGKGHEDYQIIGKTKHYFSDQAVVRHWRRA